MTETTPQDMTEITLIEGKSLPMLITSTAMEIYNLSSSSISIYIGNTKDELQLFETYIGEHHEIDGLPVGSYLQFQGEQDMVFMQWKGEGALLLTPNEVSLLARPVYSDEQKAMRYIYEAEQNNLKPAMGDDAYLRAKRNRTAETEMLLKGGTYTDEDGRERHFAGLKRALAYYTYSRLVESSNIELTRQGVVNRRSDYSDEADRQERIEASRETYAIADRYLKECLAYLAFIEGTGSCKEDNVNSNRTKIKIIGR